MKVLIADDEVKVCNLIKLIVDWEKLGLSIVGMVHDGKTAYERICALRPEIVITDIRMPNCDGLELVRRVREEYPDTYFIIISGYSQFEYAQQAIKYGVDEYLLKPLKKIELESALKKIQSAHYAKESQAAEVFELKNFVNHSRQQFKQTFLTNVVEHAQKEEIPLYYPFEETNQTYGCHFCSGIYMAAVVRPYVSDARIEAQSVEFILQKTNKTIEEGLTPLCTEILTSIRQGEVVCVLNSSQKLTIEIEKLIKRLKIDLVNMFEVRYEINVIAGIGGCYDGLEHIGRSLNEAMTALKYRMGHLDKAIFITPDDFYDSKKSAGEFIDNGFRSDISFFQERLDATSLSEKISALKEKLQPFCGDGLLVYNCFNQLMESLTYGMKNYGAEFDISAFSNYEQWFIESYSYEDLFHRVIKVIQEEYRKYAARIKSLESRPIREAKEYIHLHYNENISLETVSELAGFNPAYFSTLFKRESGSNFSEYITALRMQHAKNYLMQTGMELSEIAETVGYSDLKYFSKLFKKYAGINPTEFRKLYR